MINPYELLGVTYNSSLDEVRKSYYNLALVLHPDKGGSKDEMIILKNSYNWIKNKLEIVNERGNKTSDEIEKDFDEFLKQQEDQRPPKISDVFADAIGISYQKFLDKYKEKEDVIKISLPISYDMILSQLYYRYIRCPDVAETDEELWKFIDLEFELLQNSKHDENISTASIHHGYGNEMALSEDQDVKPFIKPDIVEYKEPESIFHPSQQVAQSTEHVAKLNDYSLKTNQLVMNDYKLAYTEQSIADSVYAHLFADQANEPLEALLVAKEIERTVIE